MHHSNPISPLARDSGSQHKWSTLLRRIAGRSLRPASDCLGRAVCALRRFALAERVGISRIVRRSVYSGLCAGLAISSVADIASAQIVRPPVYYDQTTGQVYIYDKTGAQILLNPAAVPGTVTSIGAGGMVYAAPAPITSTGAIFSQYAYPRGRLTLTSGAPVMSETVLGASTIYYTPYNGPFVPLWNGTKWADFGFGEFSVSTSSGAGGPAPFVANKNYDLFLWLNAGIPQMSYGPPWASDTSRGTGAGTTQITRGNGLFTNAVAITNGPPATSGTYVGTVRSNATATVDFSFGGTDSGGNPVAAVFGVWNNYNRITATGLVQTSLLGWSRSANSVGPANNNLNFRCSYVDGLAETATHADWKITVNPSANPIGAAAGIGLDSSTAFSTGPASYAVTYGAGANGYAALTASAEPRLLGWHYLQAMEGTSGSGAQFVTFSGAAYTLTQTNGLTCKAEN